MIKSNILEISIGVFIGLILFIIFLWIISSIIWLIYGKRYFAPERETRENAMIPYFCDDSQKCEIKFEDQFSSFSREVQKGKDKNKFE